MRKSAPRKVAGAVTVQAVPWSGGEEIYRQIYLTAPDAILVVNAGGRIVLANKAAVEMFGYTAEELDGMSVEGLMPERSRKEHREHRDHYSHFPRKRAMGTDLNLVGRRKGGQEFPVDIMLSPLRLGSEMAVISIIRDITEQRARELANQKLLRELQHDEQKLSTLTGLLPICAWCKKIRDDDGYWKKVEEYFQEHSDLDFTHGICPGCSEKLSSRKKSARMVTRSNR
jgi:PAS domain S-box-containing protein